MINTELGKQVDKRLHVRWFNTVNVDRAAHNRGGGGERSGFNAVRHDAMRCTVQRINTLNFNAVRFCARNLCAHGVQQCDQVVDLRLLRRRGNDGGALC